VNKNNINFNGIKAIPMKKISYYEDGEGADEFSSQISG
jgi:hypothetical protein